MGQPEERRLPRLTALVRVEAVRIAEVKDRLEAILSEDFTSVEVEELRGRHPQTVAGFLALKRAVIAAATELDIGRQLSPRDVELSHAASGAPVLSGSSSLVPGRAFVSLTHTRRHAYGLVVVERLGDG